MEFVGVCMDTTNLCEYVTVDTCLLICGSMYGHFFQICGSMHGHL